MKLVERKNKFLVEIRRKQKQKYFFESRKRIVKQQQQKAESWSETEKRFLDTMNQIKQLPGQDIESLSVCIHEMKRLIDSDLNWNSGLLDEPFVKKMLQIINEFGDLLGNKQLGMADNRMLVEIFQNALYLIGKLMEFEEFINFFGDIVLRSMEKMVELLASLKDLKLTNFLYIFELGVDQTFLFQSNILKSKLFKSIEYYRWDISARDNVPCGNYLKEKLQILMVEYLCNFLNKKNKNLEQIFEQSINENFFPIIHTFVENYVNYKNNLAIFLKAVKTVIFNYCDEILSKWILKSMIKVVEVTYFCMPSYDHDIIKIIESNRVFGYELIFLDLMLFKSEESLDQWYIFVQNCIELETKSINLTHATDVFFSESPLKIIESNYDQYTPYQKKICFKLLNNFMKKLETEPQKTENWIFKRISDKFIVFVILEMENVMNFPQSKLRKRILHLQTKFLTLFVKLCSPDLLNEFMKSNINFVLNLIHYAFDIESIILLHLTVALLHVFARRHSSPKDLLCSTTFFAGKIEPLFQTYIVDETELGFPKNKRKSRKIIEMIEEVLQSTDN